MKASELVQSMIFIAEGGDPASGYFGGQYKEIADRRTLENLPENHEGVFSRAFAFLVNNLKPRDPKHSRLSPMAIVTVGYQKKVYLFR